MEILIILKITCYVFNTMDFNLNIIRIRKSHKNNFNVENEIIITGKKI